MDLGGPPIQTYRCTFGSHADTVWADVRTLTWSEIAIELTTHRVGPKALFAAWPGSPTSVLRKLRVVSAWRVGP